MSNYITAALLKEEERFLNKTVTDVEPIWAVVTNTDRTEGRGYPRYIKFSRVRSTIERAAIGEGVQGSDADIQATAAIRIGSQWFLPIAASLEGALMQPTAEDKRTEELWIKKQAAIEAAKAAGLTDEQIELLSQ